MTTNSNMTKYSLRSWVLMLALAPTILVGVLLGSYFTINRFYELEDTLRDQGSNIIEPLAIASASDLASNNREAAKRLLAAAQLNKSTLVKSIAIFDDENRLFVTSHYHKDFELMRYAGDTVNLVQTEYEPVGDSLVVRTPIYSVTNLLALDDVPGVHQSDKPIGYAALLLNKEKALLEQHRAAMAAVIIVLIGVQLNLLFTFRLVKNVTQPITDMVRAVAKIREGKLDTRLNENLIGELDILKRGINAMAGSLSEYHDEMQQNIDQATSDLRETLEQIEIQNVELDLAKKRALEASRIKSEFLANMSHELRTPLNGVIGFARQLMKTSLQNNQKDYIQTIEKSASNLLSIINDILDFSKLEAGRMTFESMPFSLRETIDDTLKILSPAAQEKQLELVVDIAPEVPDNINGDSQRITQILTNLIGNAIKFTDQGSVMLRMAVNQLREEEVELHCEVEDTGVGIEESQQDVLFQAFGQADSSISRRFGGTGLGLVITKRLVDQLGGQIGFTSRTGKGSTFWFTLTLSLSQFHMDERQPVEQLKHKTVLLYEPRVLSRGVLVKRLQRWQTELVSVISLQQLHAALSQQHYDYVLISCQGFASPSHIASVLHEARAATDVLFALFDCHNQQVLNTTIRPAVDLVLPTPVSEALMAKYLLEMPVEPTNASTSDKEAGPPENMKVLAVDDNYANLKLIDTLLQEQVSDVVSASSGEEAIALCQQQSFDLIFMDIQMPGIDGISATAKIRQSQLNANTPIIAVTAHTIQEEREHILNSGMDGYLAKPIDESALKGVISRWNPNAASAQPILELQSSSINWGMCLVQANNNESLAYEMLQMLHDSISATLADIAQAQQQDDDARMLKTVHKLHGACCYSGVPVLQKLCQTVETALKQQQSIADVEPEVLELLDELAKVESAAKQILAAH
ncbi:histidine kinase [Shewanella mangrovi]|uniref:histidine kinase n=1 Tax=Shewanella mangrovi TaxID=1515746 RepID=A0A094JE84_9GAMM|nr:two-component sensor histidine kinase BarA [Shewanella mangrovi]KFZ38245.1 histidine kinase [Shewanella mangrovi]